jgi:hypothetical protein
LFVEEAPFIGVDVAIADTAPVTWIVVGIEVVCKVAGRTEAAVAEGEISVICDEVSMAVKDVADTVDAGDGIDDATDCRMPCVSVGVIAEDEEGEDCACA